MVPILMFPYITWLSGYLDSTSAGTPLFGSQGPRVLARRVAAVQPEHVRLLVVPDRHHQHHALVELLPEGLHAAVGSEVVLVAEGLLPRRAHGVAQGPELLTAERHARVRDRLAVLHVQAADLGEVARVRAVVGDELRH